MKSTFFKIGILMNAIAALFIAGCSSDSNTSPQNANSITITAIDKIAWEGSSDSAVFEVKLGSANTTGSTIKVFLQLGGSADSAKDFISSLNDLTVEIPNGQQSAKFSVWATDDDTLEETETVHFKISGCSNSSFSASGGGSDSALIMDGDGPVAVDNEGYTYKSVKIGDQTWLVENLRTIKFRNGDEIIRPGKEYWVTYYQDEHVAPCNWDTTKITTYGCLYNWAAITCSNPIAPSGWHIPTYNEWMTLINRFKGKNYAAGALKEPGTSHWNDPNYLRGMESSGFNALAAGCIGHYGDAEGFGTECYFWLQATSLNDLFVIKMVYFQASIEYCSLLGREGFSIRCIKD